MQFKIRYIFTIVIALLYLLIRNLYFQNDAIENPLSENKFLPVRAKQSYDTMGIQKNVTIILRYTSIKDGSYLVYTINSYFDKYPNIPILIVTESTLPPYLTSNYSRTSNIKIVNTKLDLLNLVVDRNPLNYIKTKYVLIIPLGSVALYPQDFIYLMLNLTGGNYTVWVLPLSNQLPDCLSLDLNLQEWTMELKRNKYNLDCDYIVGDHGIFIETQQLKRISEPFMAPYPESLLIQAKTLNMKTKLSNKSIKRIRNDNNDHKKFYITSQRTIMYLQFGIKKVIKETGVVEWYGCTRNTTRCFGNVVNSMPNYLYQGRWTPPCCLRILRETAKHVFRVLENYKIRYWLEGGSLLGAMRSNDIIPWDYDVDVGIYLEDLNKCPMLQKAEIQSKKIPKKPIIDKEGYVWEKAQTEEGKFFRVKASSTNSLHVDIFPFYPKNGIMTKDTWFLSHPQDREFPEHYLQPLTSVQFAGTNVSAPNNIREFLEFKFGKGCVEKPQYPNPKLMQFPIHHALQLDFFDENNYP